MAAFVAFALLGSAFASASLAETDVEQTQELLTKWGLHKYFGKEVCQASDAKFCVLLIFFWFLIFYGV